MNKDIKKAFNLPEGILVSRTETSSDKIIIHCRNPRIYASCSNCNKSTKKIHQYYYRNIKHSRIDFKQVILNIKVRRFKCKHCQKTFTESIKGIDKRKSTINFRLQAMDLLQRNSFRYTAFKFDISSATLTRYLLDIHNDIKVNWNEEMITKLGIDEHSFRSRNLVITITDLSHHKLLNILTNDYQITLVKYLKSIPKTARNRIKEVSIDICPSYRSVIRKYLPKAKIVADRFHVEQLANRTLDNIRSVIQYVDNRNRINIKQILLKSRYKLTENEKRKLSYAFQQYQQYPALYEAYFIKEKIKIMYNTRNKKKAIEKYNEVIRLLEDSHQNRYLKTLLKTMKGWKTEILNYFDNRTTNAYTEGIHTKIKMMKRVSFGFRNINNYIAKMTLAFIPLIWLIEYHTV